MKKYHFNRATGRTGVCSAQKRCRLDIPMDEHYDSPEAARAGFEATQEGSETITLRKKTGNVAAVSSEGISNKIEVEMKLSFESLPTFEASTAASHNRYGKSPSNVKCDECLTTISQKKVSELVSHKLCTICPNPDCKSKLNINDVVIDVDSEFADIEHNSKNCLQRTWFHSSLNEKWGEDVSNAGWNAVHLGSPAAAVDRALTEGVAKEHFFLYEVELVEEAMVQKKVLEDEESDFNFSDPVDGSANELFENDDVVAYKNRWEHPGSISLVVRPQKVRVIGARKISRDDARNVLSPYNLVFGIR